MNCHSPEPSSSPGPAAGGPERSAPEIALLDIGGEGGTPQAWNLNPRSIKTLGSAKGHPIPRHIAGRAEAIPLADQSVPHIVMERTPLTHQAMREILRVAAVDAEVVLRHALVPGFHPHRQLFELLNQPRLGFDHITQRLLPRSNHHLIETRVIGVRWING